MIKAKTKLWGLWEYKPRWWISRKGWLVVFLGLLTSGTVFITQIHAFLAENKPLPSAEILVVEGWLTDEALEKSIEEFRQGDYQLLITTGVPLERGSYLSEYRTFAELAAATLVAMGFDREKIVSVPAPKTLRNRTLISAIAVKDWLERQGKNYRRLNLYSDDVHTRRSRSIYAKVFAPRVEVGSIAASTPSYNPQTWWRESEGVRRIISETIAYIYAALFN
jgi:hypothetical protein